MWPLVRDLMRALALSSDPLWVYEGTEGIAAMPVTWVNTMFIPVVRPHSGRIQVSSPTFELLMASTTSQPEEWEATGGVEVGSRLLQAGCCGCCYCPWRERNPCLCSDGDGCGQNSTLPPSLPSLVRSRVRASWRPSCGGRAPTWRVGWRRLGCPTRGWR